MLTMARIIRSSSAAGPRSWEHGCGTCGPRACRPRWPSAGRCAGPGWHRGAGRGPRHRRGGTSDWPRSDGRARLAALGWGDWQSVRSVFGPVTLRTLDHWVIRPVQAPGRGVPPRDHRVFAGVEQPARRRLRASAGDRRTMVRAVAGAARPVRPPPGPGRLLDATCLSPAAGLPRPETSHDPRSPARLIIGLRKPAAPLF